MPAENYPNEGMIAEAKRGLEWPLSVRTVRSLLSSHPLRVLLEHRLLSRCLQILLLVRKDFSLLLDPL